MLLLRCLTYSALIVAQGALQDSLDAQFVCEGSGCFSVHWNTMRFPKCRGQCKVRGGDLVTVKTPVQAAVIAMLMAKAPKDDARVWIGLEHQYSSQCTDLLERLRGFTWVTGDSYTEYANWKKYEQKCGPLCVTVHKDETWEETPCDYKADGFLCEISYSSTCPSLDLPSSYNVTYYHQALGVSHTGGDKFPPGTIAEISTFPGITELQCDETGAWSRKTPGAWNCQIGKGGCEHECIDETGMAECRCPSGSELKADHRGCTKPCDPSPCSQLCVPDPPGFLCMCSEGYTLGADGKSCEDIDDCAANPNICSQICNNTIGSYECECHPGYEKGPHDAHDNCEDIDECDTVMCEHECVNLPGGYKCVCPEGFVLDENDGKKCNEFCNTSTCKADCVKGQKCQCPKGYILDQTEDGANICTDMDECVNSDCDWACKNTPGSYICTCHEGYTLHNGVCIPPTEAPFYTPPPTSRPEDIYSLRPTIMWGICSGILSMLIVLIAMMCHRMRRHYIYQHDLDYNYKSTDKDVVLKKIMMEPQWKI
ncbi:thrombomodulin-like [Leptodactylus fuscus]|uniref:thrombomodulin-like n=1 Tax=Leptodactylus fuscus TaxID=238119 RepID=UPI003F4E610A